MANMILGDAYLMGRDGLEKDEKSGERLLKKASKLGSVEASFRLARHLETQKANKQAKSIYVALCEVKYAPAAFVLGVSYMRGTFTEKDLNLATSYLELAADAGHLYAKDWLAQSVIDSDVSYYQALKALLTRFVLKKRIEKLSRYDPNSDLIRLG
ncbi:tetratricopeptide repeat protein [Erythrobacter sp. GH1-10]|uniref:tetratricopeptide repeat protein n=1 Tax=Erythrobacter sp. GH1-10 TaxID=3349334 RepID=UPI00387801B2